MDPLLAKEDGDGFEKRKVGIIGAGVSGILVAKYLHHLYPIVFEAKPGLGGVWRQTFASTKLQTLRPLYQFTDFPWPSHVTAMMPTHSEVLDYIQSYADHFGITDCIQFNSKVVEMRYIGNESMENVGLWGKNGGPYADGAAWEVWVQKNNGDPIQQYKFDFLVLCIGKYGDLPKIPLFPPNKGPEVFGGKVLHTMDYSALDEKQAYELLKGKKVVIIGFQKSAIDFALECAEANQGEGGQPCTMVFRRNPWIIPEDYKFWGVHLAHVYFTRFAEFLLEKPDQGFLLNSISRLLAPVRWAVSKFLELYLIWKFPLKKYGLVPDHSYVEDVASCLSAILPANFFPKAEEGLIRFRRTSSWGFSNNGVVLNDGTELEADVVVLGTGYDGTQKLKNLLPVPFAEILERSEGVIPLYRGLIHPNIPQMAIMGYSESYSNLHSSEIRSQWLAHLFAGKFVLPSVKEMEANTVEHEKYVKRITPFYYRSCHGIFQIRENDDLCKDMGRNRMRKGNWFKELFEPYSNLDYAEVNI